MLIRDYQKGDIYKILQNQIENAMMKYTTESNIMDHIAFTAIDYKGRIVGSAGLVKMWDGVYEAWIALDERIKRSNSISLLKILKKCINGLPKDVKRIHGFVNQKLPNQEHFMKFLGFEQEAILKGYFPNNFDCVVWRKLYGV